MTVCEWGKGMGKKKLVVVMNGQGGVGKDTLCDALRTAYQVVNISAITPIKEIAAAYGWNGEKDERSRRFLANLKRTFADYNDLPNRYLLGEYERFCSGPADILCVHIRESDQIEKFVSGVALPCVTILFKRDMGERGRRYGNDADDGVGRYRYDYEFDNNGSIEESAERFRALIRSVLLSH